VRRVHSISLPIMILCLSGCGHVFVLSQTQSRDEMLSRASLVMVGVIESHHWESWPFFRVSLPSDAREGKYWRVLRRRVRVETVLRGSESRKSIDVYEIFWTGGATGDWNATQDGERDVFLLRVEGGYYHVVQDWSRSIFTVTSGPHDRLPLDDSYPLWERIALMNWWIQRSDTAVRISNFLYNDPAGVLSLWRTVKLERGLLRHPSAGVRVPACRELLLLAGWGQDECWEMLTSEERNHLHDGGYFCCSESEVIQWRTDNQQQGASRLWQTYTDRESRRLLTAMNNRQMRTEFCRLYDMEYPGDKDSGCPADLPPPATIVTEQGDIPLNGRWPM
jgi:uncharacterized protein YceK